MKFKSVTKGARSAAAAFLAVWLSGFIFLFCCHRPATAAAESAAVHGGHCHEMEAPADTQGRRIEKQPAENPDCCAFIPAFFDKTRTIDTLRHIAAATPASTAKLVAVRRPSSTFVPFVLSTSFLLPKNRTFLINRTIRI